jgi:predicted N-acetyltransferase YhbS
MSTIIYHTERTITPLQLAGIFERSGINRPTHDLPRMEQMLNRSDVLVTAWDEEKLIGVARSLSDFCFCCYLSDLAVDREYQHSGIGKQLIALTQDKIGPKTTLLLLAAPSAMAYYPKVGFEAVPNGWTIKRSQ